MATAGAPREGAVCSGPCVAFSVLGSDAPAAAGSGRFAGDEATSGSGEEGGRGTRAVSGASEAPPPLAAATACCCWWSVCGRTPAADCGRRPMGGAGLNPAGWAERVPPAPALVGPGFREWFSDRIRSSADMRRAWTAGWCSTVRLGLRGSGDCSIGWSWERSIPGRCMLKKAPTRRGSLTPVCVRGFVGLGGKRSSCCSRVRWRGSAADGSTRKSYFGFGEPQTRRARRSNEEGREGRYFFGVRMFVVSSRWWSAKVPRFVSNSRQGFSSWVPTCISRRFNAGGAQAGRRWGETSRGVSVKMRSRVMVMRLVHGVAKGEASLKHVATRSAVQRQRSPVGRWWARHDLPAGGTTTYRRSRMAASSSGVTLRILGAVASTVAS